MGKNLLPAWVGCLLLCGPINADGPNLVARDEQLLRAAQLKSDGESLLIFFRGRTISEAERAKVMHLISQLGAASFRQREEAAVALIARGPVALELLKEAVNNADPEVSRRAEKCLQRIQAGDVGVEVPAAAARLLAIRKPGGAVEVLLAYLPFADNDLVADEVRSALTVLAVRDGRPDPLLVAGLSDPRPWRRATAGEVLCRTASADLKPTLRKLLADPQALVRFRLALALAWAQEKEAVPVLIDLLPELTMSQAWQAEELLYRLAEDLKPPSVALGHDAADRKKCRDAWAAWWQTHAAKINLASLQKIPPALGHTMVVLLDTGRIVEVDRFKQVRWKIDNLVFPLDAQFLPDTKGSGDRVLVAEYHAGRVTERLISTGEIKWEKRLVGPLVAQRLTNGHTFMATDSQFIETDQTGKDVLTINLPNGERNMKAMKLPSGEIACLTSEARVVRFDATGKELHSFTVSLGNRLFGGRIHMLPSGRVLIPHNGENKVVEYDANGKAVWEVQVDQPIAALRLPNGHTLITSMSPQRGTVEFDRHGQEVWSYSAGTRITRALRR